MVKHYFDRHPLPSYIEFPLEQHLFAVNPNDDYLCRVCGRPRALHVDPEELVAVTPATDEPKPLCHASE